MDASIENSLNEIKKLVDAFDNSEITITELKALLMKLFIMYTKEYDRITTDKKDSH